MSLPLGTVNSTNICQSSSTYLTLTVPVALDGRGIMSRNRTCVDENTRKPRMWLNKTKRRAGRTRFRRLVELDERKNVRNQTINLAIGGVVMQCG